MDLGSQGHVRVIRQLGPFAHPYFFALAGSCRGRARGGNVFPFFRVPVSNQDIVDDFLGGIERMRFCEEKVKAYGAFATSLRQAISLMIASDAAKISRNRKENASGLRSQ